jgi:hypothetical protein
MPGIIHTDDRLYDAWLQLYVSDPQQCLLDLLLFEMKLVSITHHLQGTTATTVSLGTVWLNPGICWLQNAEQFRNCVFWMSPDDAHMYTVSGYRVGGENGQPVDMTDTLAQMIDVFNAKYCFITRLQAILLICVFCSFRHFKPH